MYKTITQGEDLAKKKLAREAFLLLTVRVVNLYHWAFDMRLSNIAVLFNYHIKLNSITWMIAIPCGAPKNDPYIVFVDKPDFVNTAK